MITYPDLFFGLLAIFATYNALEWLCGKAKNTGRRSTVA